MKKRQKVILILSAIIILLVLNWIFHKPIFSASGDNFIKTDFQLRSIERTVKVTYPPLDTMEIYKMMLVYSMENLPTLYSIKQIGVPYFIWFYNKYTWRFKIRSPIDITRNEGNPYEDIGYVAICNYNSNQWKISLNRNTYTIDTLSADFDMKDNEQVILNEYYDSILVAYRKDTARINKEYILQQALSYEQNRNKELVVLYDSLKKYIISSMREKVMYYKLPQSIHILVEVEAYKKDYIEKGFDAKKHAIFSNEQDIKIQNAGNTPIPAPQATLQQITNEPLKPTIKSKAIYNENDIPRLANNLKEGLLFTNTAYGIYKVIKSVADLYKTSAEIDQELFAEFRAMVNTLFAVTNVPMRIIVNNMINRFQSNTGGVFQDVAFNSTIKHHPSTKRYCSQLEDYMRHKLLNNGGDISKLEDKEIYLKSDEKKRKGKDKVFSVTPVYDAGFISFKDWWRKPEQITNATQGYTIALNDIWATQVWVTKYQLYEDKTYELEYQVTLWDHFGLDLQDIQAEKFAGWLDGFKAWFILQHFRGYKPFITKITFTNNCKGSIDINAPIPPPPIAQDNTSIQQPVPKQFK